MRTTKANESVYQLYNTPTPGISLSQSGKRASTIAIRTLTNAAELNGGQLARSRPRGIRTVARRMGSPHTLPMRITYLALSALCFTSALSAQQPTAAPKYDRTTYQHRSADIPMRDGLTLHVEMFWPKDATEALPFLFQRTPYGVAESGGRLTGGYSDLADEGYIFVFQDIRGRYKSEGTFVMQRAPRPVDSPSRAIDEGTDTHDSIDWLLKNGPKNNGRVGMLGVSYDGWTAAMGMLDGHAALRAVSPQASPADMFIGDDFHHNGAFRLSYGFEYAYLTEASKENSDFDFDRYDTFDWYLKLGPLSNVQSKVLRGKTLPTWTDFSTHPVSVTN